MLATTLPTTESPESATPPSFARTIEVEVETEVLPRDLEAMPAGPVLAVIVSSIDRSRLSDHDAVRLLAARDRLVSHLQAARAADIAEVVSRSGDDFGDFAALEVGAALHLTRIAVQGEVTFAVDVTSRLPGVGALLEAGRIDQRRARVLADGTAHLPVDMARSIVAEVADRAPSLTTGQLRALLKRRCIAVDPADAAARLGHAVEQRRVVLDSTVDGSANLRLLDIPPDAAVAARDRIDDFARSLPDDGRTMDQRRADAAIDILCGRGHPPRRGTVDLTVDLATLLGLAESPGDLAGWGPVVADVARQIAGKHVDGRWQASVIDDDGDPCAVAVRRRPTASQARQVRARNRTCVFPGCRRSARQSDIDHTRRHVDGGPTLERNLAPLCEFHHRAKDEGGWRYRRLPGGGYRWTSPHGHAYTTSGRSP
jgi:hypothetical protein